MNFEGFEFDQNTRATLNALDSRGRMPHAIIIESQDGEAAQKLAALLSMYAVCGSEGSRPCGVCPNCVKAKNRAHPDINYPKVKNKSQTYDVDSMREIIEDAYENAQRLLVTIRSRCTVFRLGGEISLDESAVQAAEKIAEGITAAREYELMLAFRALGDKDLYEQIFIALKQIFRDSLAILSGAEPLGNAQLAGKLAARFTKMKLINMIELCDSSALQIKQNVNINLLTTRLCGEFRRISWQR